MKWILLIPMMIFSTTPTLANAVDDEQDVSFASINAAIQGMVAKSKGSANSRKKSHFKHYETLKVKSKSRENHTLLISGVSTDEHICFLDGYFFLDEKSDKHRTSDDAIHPKRGASVHRGRSYQDQSNWYVTFYGEKGATDFDDHENIAYVSCYTDKKSAYAKLSQAEWNAKYANQLGGIDQTLSEP